MLAKDFIRSSDLAFWKYENTPVTNTTTASTMPRYKFSKSCDEKIEGKMLLRIQNKYRL